MPAATAPSTAARDKVRTVAPKLVELTEKDLPLHCPMPGAPLWARHPRVFLDVVKHGEALCPYCGTKYLYKGAAPKGH